MSVDECYRGRNVRVFRLDRRAVLDRLRERARAMVERRPDVLEVRVFGSLARADAHPGSDADLFIVMRDDAGPFLSRTADLARHFEGVGVGCDLIAFTEAEVIAARARGDRFVRTVFEDGLTLATQSRR